jgi:hypothetical protein
MAIVITIISGLAGLAAALVALIGFDVSWSYALMVYLVTATLPAAVFLGAIYLQMLIHRSFGAPDILTKVQRSR